MIISFVLSLLISVSKDGLAIKVFKAVSSWSILSLSDVLP